LDGITQVVITLTPYFCAAVITKEEMPELFGPEIPPYTEIFNVFRFPFKIPF
jgi:hypothetical protein